MNLLIVLYLNIFACTHIYMSVSTSCACILVMLGMKYARPVHKVSSYLILAKGKDLSREMLP